MISELNYEPLSNYLYGLPCGLFFYALNEGKLSEINDTQVVGNSSAIQSIQLAPFVAPDDLMISKIKYDVEKYGQEQGSDCPNVFRIGDIKTPRKTLGKFKCYNPQLNIGGSFDYRNESRLYNYPYQFAYLTDHLNPPLEIHYHLCKENENEIKVLNTISDRCSYGLYIDGYKGDIDGKLEAMVSSGAHELPCSSNAYNSWVATNKNQMTQNIRNQQATTYLQNQGVSINTGYNNKALDQQMWADSASTVVGTIESIVGLFTGAGTGLGNNIGSTVRLAQGNDLAKSQNRFNSLNTQAINNQNVQNSIQSAMALGKDMKNLPNTMISMGSEVYYGYVKGDKKLQLIRMGITDVMAEKIGRYFHMYGYKQNKILPISTRSRYYFNYIKTVGCNITANIPRNHLEALKSIFNNGVTLWHIDRDGVEPLNYFKADNYEYKEDSSTKFLYPVEFEIFGDSLVNECNEIEEFPVTLQYESEGENIIPLEGNYDGKAHIKITGNIATNIDKKSVI